MNLIERLKKIKFDTNLKVFEDCETEDDLLNTLNSKDETDYELQYYIWRHDKETWKSYDSWDLTVENLDRDYVLSIMEKEVEYWERFTI